MEQGKGVVMVQQNPLQAVNTKVNQLQLSLKQLESNFKAWLAKQPLAVEAAIVTLTSATQGAVIGGIMGTITGDMAANMPVPPPNAGNLNNQAMASLQQAQVFVSSVWSLFIFHYFV